jgi:hypothetical protein
MGVQEYRTCLHVYTRSIVADMVALTIVTLLTGGLTFSGASLATALART